MRKLNLFVGALAIVALASCSNDEVVSNVESAQLAQQSIGFSPLTKGATRAAVNKAEDLGDFAVTAYVNTPQAAGTDGKHYFGSAAGETWSQTAGTIYAYGSPASPMKNIVISYSAGGWDYANTTEVKYWPYIKKADDTFESTTTLDFVAISPASLVGKYSSDTYKDAQITGFEPNGEDVCYAYTTGAKQADGAVTLEFKHQLSQIVFAAKAASGLSVEIGEIKLANINNKGDWKTQSGAADFGNKSWSLNSPGTTLKSYAGISGPATVTASGDATDAQVLTATGSEILIIPQKAEDYTYNPAILGANSDYVSSGYGTNSVTSGKTWAVEDYGTSDVKAAVDGTTTVWDATNNAALENVSNKAPIYLKVSVKIKAADGSYTLGSASAYDDIYYAVKTNWEAGKKYTYTLLFGGVKDNKTNQTTSTSDIVGGTYNNGAKVFTPTPITFSATIVDWEDAYSSIGF